MATIKDVAREAGVSKSTVSRALSGHPAVRVGTREAVQEAARRLNYRTSPVGRALRSGASRLLGLVITNLVNASFQQIAEQVHATAHGHGYQMLLAVTDGSGERECEILNALLDHRVEGLLIVPTGSNTAFLNSLGDQGIPVVSLVRYPEGSLTPAVLDDDYRGALIATSYLLSLGHRRIGYVGGPSSVRTGSERWRGFEEAHREAGVAIEPSAVFRGPFDPEFGRQATRLILRRRPRPTALLVANHEAMFGVLPTLSAAGAGVPDDLSIVGFEDAPLFRFWHPAVTVIDTQPKKIGAVAFEALMKEAGRASLPRTTPPLIIEVPAKLVIRSSAVAPRIEPNTVYPSG